MADDLNEQERFWAGEFGDDYMRRNAGPKLLASNLALFSRILTRTRGIGSVIELGANVGMNLRALRQLLPDARLVGLEINALASSELSKIDGVEAVCGSLLGYVSPEPFDLAFTKGVLIHIGPEHLARAYDALHAASRRWICVAEYYNPTPATVTYRGQTERLFKRDFAGELLDRHADLQLVDYGFVYRRDNVCPQDDITWFLLEKSGA